MFNIYATDYAPVDPITPPCDIVPIFIGYKGENKARCLVFDLTECVSTFGDGGFVISFIRQGDELPYLVTNTDRLDNNAIWIINSTDTAVDGYGMVQLQYIVDDVICKSALYRTVTFDSNGITGDVPDPYEDLLAQIAAYAATAEGAATTATAAANTATTAVENGIVTERSQRIAADNGLQQQITNLMGLAGAPVMANTAAAMTDSSKIYVYTGSEAGYVFGNWYYFNGAEWVSGGVYQASAVQTDPTLSVEGMAADAAATGDLKSQIYSAFVEESASGSIASFDDGADDVPVADLVVNITPKQDGSGDPSPTNVRSITGFDAAEITVTGKNILHIINNGGTSNGLTYVYNDDGSVLVNGTSTANNSFRNLNYESGKCYMPKGVPLKMALKKSDNNNALGMRAYVDGVYVMTFGPEYDDDDWHYSNTFTVPVTATSAYVRMNVYASGTTLDNVIAYPMVVLADDTVTEFDPYNGTTYPISFGSAGTVYKGQLDPISGMLTVTAAMVDLGTLTWGFHSESLGIFRGGNISNLARKTAAQMYAISSSYKYTTQGFGAMSDKTMRGSTDAPSSWFIRDTSYTTVAAFQSAMNGVQLLYELANPISVQLSAQDIKTLLGNNNIWSDTGSVASCEYRADTQLYIEKLTNPDNDMTADSNIASGQYFMVNNTLYLATAAIASGATITPGTNCTETNLAAALNAINA